MAEIENGYYYIEDGVVLKEDGYTNSVDKVGKVVGFDYEQGIRTKSIEKFAEQIELGISESIIWDMIATASKNGSLSDTSDKIVDYVIETIKEIAESMKGEKE